MMLATRIFAPPTLTHVSCARPAPGQEKRALTVIQPTTLCLNCGYFDRCGLNPHSEKAAVWR